MTVQKRKLIEVALPLEAINRESAREKSLRHGHPSSLHLWWARRPLAACRAVLFAQLVDDPSSHPDLFPTEEDQAVERQRLFDIIERLVVWENTTDKALLREAHQEILRSTGGNPPTILDPFAGGGSIPLEAQRLGLLAEASDLNPVAVLINKALVDIPPRWAERVPVFPDAAGQRTQWPGASGLAEDVRRYGRWIREEAQARAGHLYPLVRLSDGSSSEAIAWIWARTVTCPNPACGIETPLVKSWWLGKKRGKEAYVIPAVGHDELGNRRVVYKIGSDSANAPHGANDGTVSRNGARCIACETAASLDYVRKEGQAGRLGEHLIAVVAEGARRRHYVAPSPEHESAARVGTVEDVPDAELSTHPQYMGTPRYGLTRQSDLFTQRQLFVLSLLSALVGEAREKVRSDAQAAGLSLDGISLESGGLGADAYADSIAIYLGLIVSKLTDYQNALSQWRSDAKNEGVGHLFSRQAIPMVWDFAEGAILGEAAGSFARHIEAVPNSLDRLGEAGPIAHVEQADAATRSYDGVLVCTDPPYYDNVPYADLSDFFYGWLRKSLLDVLPRLFATVQTPKADELVADSVRLGSKSKASEFFEIGFTQVFSRLRRSTPEGFPVAVFYAFKQTDSDADGTANTGWQTLLTGMVQSGWEVTATWPMRTELANRMRSIGSNALASSVVLALRPRPATAETVNRRTFVNQLRAEMPRALRELQQGSIAPVDLAQAAIGPGMAVFSRHARVIESDGSEMTVRTALALINQALDEVLSQQESDFDSETRFALKWFSQFGWNEGASGEADVLSRAVNTSTSMLERGGVFRATAGRARLLEPSELSLGWVPADDKHISVWEVALRISYALRTQGVDQAVRWMQDSSSRVELAAVKELSYLLYSICEKRGWADAAILFNGLGTSWSDLQSSARAPKALASTQGLFDLSSDDDD